MLDGRVMRAVAFYEHGGPEVLQLVDWAKPEAGPEEVVVEVKACALNHLDVFVRRGMPGVTIELPHISGGDVAGIVHEVGSGVTGVKPGARVLIDPGVVGHDGKRGALGEHVRGGLCEFLAVPAANLLTLDDSIDYTAAAALPIAYGTAYRMLFTRGQVMPDEIVVVLGASGGVGTACVQLAKWAGATVVAVASSEEKLAKLRVLGADHLVQARGPEFSSEVWQLTGKRGADVIVDNSGRDTFPGSLRALKKGGRILVCGATSGHEALTDLRYIFAREETIIGSDGWRRSDLEKLLRLVEAGDIKPVIDCVIPLEGVRAAEEAIERREIFGKVVVAP